MPTLSPTKYEKVRIRLEKVWHKYFVFLFTVHFFEVQMKCHNKKKWWSMKRNFKRQVEEQKM